ncbi:uncharacterized protein LOC111115802 [Crassostrea virginica]
MTEFKFFNDRESVSDTLITAEDFGLYAPPILCLGTVLSLGFGPAVEINNVLLNVLAEQTVSAAILFTLLNLMQVFYPVVRHEEENSGSAPCSSSSSADLQLIDAASQTDDRNYRLETMAMKQKYDKAIRKISRDSRAIRIRYGKQIRDLRQKVTSADKELSSLQLQIPALENERSALLSETGAVDTQLNEEQTRYDTLMSKFKTFHAQLVESGIASLMTLNFSNIQQGAENQINLNSSSTSCV